MINNISKMVDNSLFYIVAPKFTTSSAGIRVLHLLCHMLNEHGFQAYIVVMPKKRFPRDNIYLNPQLNTRLLLPSELEKHRQIGIEPIVIYPEIIRGNPYQAKHIVRYLLNFPGLLGGDESFPSTDFVMSYSKCIHDSCVQSQHHFFIPSFNWEVFWYLGNEEREITCFYASKFRKLGGDIWGLPLGCVEITSGQPNSLTQQAVGDLLRRAKVLYVFENTHLIAEAIICGCPVVLMFNQYFKEILGMEYFSLNGCALSDSKEAIAQAVESIPKALVSYAELEGAVNNNLFEFITKVQAFYSDNKGFHFVHSMYNNRIKCFNVIRLQFSKIRYKILVFILLIVLIIIIFLFH